VTRAVYISRPMSRSRPSSSPCRRNRLLRTGKQDTVSDEKCRVVVISVPWMWIEYTSLARSSGEPSPDYLPITAYCQTSRSIWSSDAFTSSPNPLVTSSCIPPVCSHLRANNLGGPPARRMGSRVFPLEADDRSNGTAARHESRGIYRNCTNC
jgi:hypothetical protein